MTDARTEMLARIRRALHDEPAPDPVERTYRTADTRDARSDDEIVELLIDRLEDYKATVRRCSPDDIAGTVAEAFAARGARRVVVPSGLDEQWLAEVDMSITTDDPPPRPADLDQLDGVITTCAVAIAETGTLILDAGPGQGRRALTLVPDYHLIVVPADRIVPAVPLALSRLSPERPLTWISGPSATSDIELERVVGVHGPRNLDVIVVA